MGIETVPRPPSGSDFALCDFWLFPKLRGCHYEKIEEMKEALMKIIDTLTQEDSHGAFQKFVGTVQQVHCSLKRLLQGWLEFHECTINNITHTETRLETYLMILVYISLYDHLNHFFCQVSKAFISNNFTIFIVRLLFLVTFYRYSWICHNYDSKKQHASENRINDHTYKQYYIFEKKKIHKIIKKYRWTFVAHFLLFPNLKHYDIVFDEQHFSLFDSLVSACLFASWYVWGSVHLTFNLTTLIQK